MELNRGKKKKLLKRRRKQKIGDRMEGELQEELEIKSGVNFLIDH
jgi:hypothetical protein